jgi:hypothetical protein
VTTQAEEQIRQPDVPHCPDWCRWDDCAGATEREDRIHFGTPVYGPLTLHKRELFAGGETRYLSFELHLRQHAEAAAPSVELGIIEAGPDFVMTLDEARELAGALLEVCDLAGI